MNLHWIDWTIIVALLSALIGVTLYARKYTRSVADFLAANRMAGRYLLTVSAGFGGAISIIASWEMVYKAGLPTQWWGMMSIPLGLMIGLTGFVVYRLRQTRALTLAQFLEMRYSRKFRFFAGGLCWISGVLNYGIFPMVTANFIISFFGLPEHFVLMGIKVGMFPAVMFVYLGIAIFIAIVGGQISIMITDFIQGMLMMVIYLVLMFFLLYKFNWSDIIAGLQCTGEGQSLINPFNTSKMPDFDIWYFLIGILGAVYGVRAWQGNSGYNAAAKTPHEAVMANIVGSWRGFASGLCMLLIPLTAYAVMHLPAFSNIAAPIQADLNKITDEATRNQMVVPMFLSHLLPVGLMGMFAAIIIACAISCDDTYIHAWGSILVQDVIMPLRKKPFKPKNHMLLLRLAIVGIAAFGFIFSMYFPLKGYILMYFALTGAIYLGGAGSVIIGGLYWKRGTTYGAYTALISGTVLGLGGMVLEQVWPGHLAPYLHSKWPDNAWLTAHLDKFPVNGQVIYFYAMLTAIVSYVLVSLLGPKHVHNMDKLLHRGKYAVEQDIAQGDKKYEEVVRKKRIALSALIGITKDFTLFDRCVAYCTFYWSMSWWVLFLAGTFLSLTTTLITDQVWSIFWWFKLVAFSVVLGSGCTIWILCGGIRDAYRLFRDLRAERIDAADDGFVKHEPDDEI